MRWTLSNPDKYAVSVLDPPPNPYEAFPCQETNGSYERIVLIFFRCIGPGAVDRRSCTDMMSVSRCQPSMAAPHTS